MVAISTLGKRILLARRDRGLTQTALAEAGGISANTIARLERGLLQDLKGATVARLADYLDLPTDYLLGLMTEEELTTWTETREEPQVRRKSPGRKPAVKASTQAPAPKRTRTPTKAAKG